MVDANKLVGQLMQGGFGSGLAGGVLGGAVAGALAGGKGKKLASGALKLGGMALVAGVAWQAWQTYQRQQAGPGAPGPITLPETPAALPPAVQESVANPRHGLAVLRAMIAAAKCDGMIDAAEQQKIFSQLGQQGLSAEDKAFLLEELGRPLDLDSIVNSASDPLVAAEVYAASRLVIAEASPAETAYLGLLAARLQLDPALVRQLDQATAAAPG